MGPRIDGPPKVDKKVKEDIDKLEECVASMIQHAHNQEAYLKSRTENDQVITQNIDIETAVYCLNTLKRIQNRLNTCESRELTNIKEMLKKALHTVKGKSKPYRDGVAQSAQLAYDWEQNEIYGDLRNE